MKKIFTLIFLYLLLLPSVKAQPGSLDLSFNPGTGFSGGSVLVITEQSDGKILVGGAFTSYNGSNYNRIIRLNTNGSIDNTFNPGTGADGEIYAITVQPDGKILIGGNFASFNGNNINRVARLNSNGTFDSSFNPGNGASNQVREILLQANGKIIIAGWFDFVDNKWNQRMARLNSNGSLDTTFYSGNSTIIGEIYSAVSLPGKRTIIGGSFTSFKGTPINRIACIDSTGAVDPSFSVGAGLDQQVNDIHLLNDTLLTVTGYFQHYNNVFTMNVVQLKTDGTMKTTLNTGTGFAGGGPPFAVATQNDGKICTGGLFISYNGSTANFFTRINANGTIDGTFNTGTSADYNVFDVKILNSGKIMIGGGFLNYNGTSRHGIARIRNAACNNTSSNITVSSCNSYISPSGKHTWTISGNYIDTIPNSIGCDSIININLTVNTVDNTVSVNSPVITSNAIGATYQWLDCNFSMAVISGATNQSYTASTNGIYAVAITQNGCKDTSVCTALSDVGIAENDFASQVKIYPNPAKERIAIELHQTYYCINVKIRNLFGEEIKTQTFQQLSKIELSLNEPAGIYFMEITVDNNMAFLKIIKE